jgi:hypothetical protein
MNSKTAKKILFTALLVIWAGISTKAQQNGAYAKGDNLLNIGLGINSAYNGGIPFGISYEKGITEDISLGGNFDYLSHEYLSDFEFTSIYIGARGSYHFNNLLKIKSDQLDLYGGATLGYRNFSWKDTNQNLGDSSYGSGIFLGAYIGGKYYFSNKIAGFAEFGEIGSTNAKIGLAFKF